jgi:type II secretory pathway pseudopilin PulG
MGRAAGLVNVRTRVPRIRRIRDDAGFTLIELGVAGLMFTIILFAAFTALDVSTKAERGQQARHEAMLEIRSAMDRFTKDLRQATYVDPASNHNKITMKTIIEGAETDVVYELVALGGDIYELRRKVGVGTAFAIVKNMVVGTTPFGAPDPPFCYSYYSAGAPSQCIDTTNAAGGRVPGTLTAIRVTLAKDPEFNPGEPITLATDVQLRNV